MTVATDPRKTGIQAGMTLLAASAVVVSVTGTTSETALATVTIPAGAMGLNGGLYIYTTWSYTNSANAKTLRARFGGAAGTAILSSANTTTASQQQFTRGRNRGSASSQVWGLTASSSPFATSASSVPTTAVDTTAAVDIVISGQLALGAETITLESYEVWLLPG